MTRTTDKLRKTIMLKENIKYHHYNNDRNYIIVTMTTENNISVSSNTKGGQ